MQVEGSSPRVWGQALFSDLKGQTSGIIPTRVGTRVITSGQEVISQDHPHACGDKYSPVAKLEAGKGSSPRVWGQVVQGVIMRC